MKTYNVNFAKIEQNTPSTKVYTIELDQDMEYEPGQFITLLIEKDGQLHRRPYSIASSGKDKRTMELAIKLYEQGAITPFLHQIKEGYTCKAIGPFGKFTLDTDNKRPVMMAAGSGIAPFVGMLRHMAENKGYKPTLIFSNKFADDVIYRDTLSEFEQQIQDFTFVQTFTKKPPEGWQGLTSRVDIQMIQSHCEMSASKFYLCGPPTFVADVFEQLLNAGVDKEDIKREIYD